jgi:hypothetical protein
MNTLADAPLSSLSSLMELDAKPAKPTRRSFTGKRGRPRDLTGITTMGKARLIYQENPTYTTTQLRDAIMAQTGCKHSVAATYASKVKKGKKVA